MLAFSSGKSGSNVQSAKQPFFKKPTHLFQGLSRTTTIKLSEAFSSMVSAAKWLYSKIVNEYDQEIPQSQTADNPVAP